MKIRYKILKNSYPGWIFLPWKMKYKVNRVLEEMIDFCVPKTVENTDMDEKTARKMLNEAFPQLKRWK